MAAVGCSNGLAPRNGRPLGSLSVDLTLPTGATISHVDYTIVGAALQSPLTGMIDVSVPGSTVSVGVSALPAGSGYLLTLTGTASDGSTCATSARFDIAAGSTTQLGLTLECKMPDSDGTVTIDVTLNTCPVIASLTVQPLVINEGGQITLTSSATDADGDPLSYAWTATQGSFASPAQAATTYTCVLGSQMLVLTVDDHKGCKKSAVAQVSCTPITCNGCDAHATCMNVGGQGVCVCGAGYQGTGTTCADIDECATGLADCSANATCTNTQGSFTCACKSGYQGDGRTCTDIDECATHTDNCSTNATCTNTPGSFTCACKTGYQGDGRTCTDIDECATGIANCGVGTCSNTPGSFICICPTGYNFSLQTCVDIDECATGANNCGTTQVCENTPGSYYCLAKALARVSLSTAAGDPDGASERPAFSADGRYVAFNSQATNLVASDTNGKVDVFVRDRLTGQTSLVSASSSGTQANDNSLAPAISADGRYIAFHSIASNLVPGDTNGRFDVFVRDMATSQTTRVSVSTAGVEGTGGGIDSMWPAISADGKVVVFQSLATNLVANDTNGVQDVFIRDLGAGTTTRASVSSTGVQSDQMCSEQVISADGRFVAYSTFASTLVSNDTNGFIDVFLYDRGAATTTRVSVGNSGAEGNQASFHPVLSSDGHFVAFTSNASNLISSDGDGVRDVFVRDRLGNTTTRVSLSTSGAEPNGACTLEAISGDGRYVTFSSTASNLVSNDNNGVEDVFVRDRTNGLTLLVSVSAGGAIGNQASTQPAISPDGHFIGFSSMASNLVPNDLNGVQDIFVVSSPLLP
ncbi:MAG: EGF domain-containing protein [Polyangiales bacterium]